MAVPPDFVAGQVLTAAQMNLIGSWLVKAQTIGSGVSSVTVTDAFSADYENYRIVVSGGSTSAATGIFSLTLGSANTGYYRFGMYGAFNSSTVTGDNASNASNFGNVAYGTANGLIGDITVYRPFTTSRTAIKADSINQNTTGVWFTQGGYQDSSTSFTAFTLTVNTGTFTGGTIYVYGLRD